MTFIRLIFEQSVLKLKSISRPILRISKFASNQAEFQIASRFRLFYSRFDEAKRHEEIFCMWILLIRQLFSFGGSSFRKNMRGTWIENINDGCRVQRSILEICIYYFWDIEWLGDNGAGLTRGRRCNMTAFATTRRRSLRFNYRRWVPSLSLRGRSVLRPQGLKWPR